MATIITLLTDFGTRDSYVAELKAVLASQAHPALLIDITHEIPPGDIASAQYILARVWQRFPRGTVHVVIVDPGVGTSRRALAAESGGQFFVAPDNGLLSALPSDTRFVELPIPPGVSPTFHARDVFAPAAAQLANGTALPHLGHAIKDPVRLERPQARAEGSAIIGQVVYIDRFGTLVTNIPGAGLDGGARVAVDGREVGPVHRTFGDVGQGEVVALIGSGGTLEVAVRDGSAAATLGVKPGTEVRARVTRPA
ncbi:MAG TPA: SAM-dependent chlorinase/fluorinase [Gemmatimonadales bacterium]|nr:SAM-dependent chlorinase/fluorinase [Gemmatimonadales bacterium]